MPKKPAKETGAPKGAPRGPRIVANGLRAKAVEYLSADVVDMEEVAVILQAAAHLIDALYEEKDAAAAVRHAQAVMKAAAKHRQLEPEKEFARKIFDRWQDPRDALTFRTNTAFGHYVVTNTKGKLRSVEHWAKQASRWKKE